MKLSIARANARAPPASRVGQAHALGNDAGLQIPPQRHQQFPRERHRHHLADAPFAEAYPAVPGYSIPPFGPLWVNKAPIGRQIGIAASLATKTVRPASEASKTSAWAIVAVTWDSGISLFRPATATTRYWSTGSASRLSTPRERSNIPWPHGLGD